MPQIYVPKYERLKYTRYEVQKRVWQILPGYLLGKSRENVRVNMDVRYVHNYSRENVNDLNLEIAGALGWRVRKAFEDALQKKFVPPPIGNIKRKGYDDSKRLYRTGQLAAFVNTWPIILEINETDYGDISIKVSLLMDPPDEDELPLDQRTLLSGQARDQIQGTHKDLSHQKGKKRGKNEGMPEAGDIIEKTIKGSPELSEVDRVAFLKADKNAPQQGAGILPLANLYFGKDSRTPAMKGYL